MYIVDDVVVYIQKHLLTIFTWSVLGFIHSLALDPPFFSDALPAWRCNLPTSGFGALVTRSNPRTHTYPVTTNINVVIVQAVVTSKKLQPLSEYC